MLAIPVMAGGQTPRYTPEFLGPAQPGRMNSSGEVIGRVSVDGNVRGVVLRSGQPTQLLPLPAGMISSVATDISDLGMVVGQVGPFYSPEFSGRATAWYPDGLGGYSVVVLGVLSGHVVSSAIAVNSIGDIVGTSGDGTYRYAVHFRAPNDLVDLSPLGIFDPVAINDQRVLVDNSSTAKRLDLDIMIPEDLGIPDPPGDVNYVATRTAAINESGQVAGSAILATSTSCDRQVTRYTDGAGWEIFSSCGPNNGASDINDSGDMVMRITITPYVRLEGGGTFSLESVIVNEIGHWYAVTTSAGWINNERQIVMYGTNPTTGQTGALLLTPEATTAVPEQPAGLQLATAAEPNPFQVKTTIRFSVPSSGLVDLAIYDTAGRKVAALLVGAWRGVGANEVTWDGRDLRGVRVSSGVYFASLRAGGATAGSRLVLRR
ncbi:MAG: T9SS type A sorting domain-containing protein [bacterium]